MRGKAGYNKDIGTEGTLIYTRRNLLKTGAAAAAAGLISKPALASILPAGQPQVDPKLMERARAALESKRGIVTHADVIGIADFSKASRDPRFYLVDVASGSTTSYQVAHGIGSDPDHSGWLELFSNAVGSEATSSGAYLTQDIYYGKYGRSLRLRGLDPTNSNAEERAIVVHSAWYAEPEVAEQYGKLGRSEGCFALSQLSLQYVLQQLGPGRLLYSDKV